MSDAAGSAPSYPYVTRLDVKFGPLESRFWIGRALIEAVYERAPAAGASRVYWQTHETNRTAMALCDRVAERSGFLVYRRTCEDRRENRSYRNPEEEICVPFEQGSLSP